MPDPNHPFDQPPSRQVTTSSPNIDTLQAFTGHPASIAKLLQGKVAPWLEPDHIGFHKTREGSKLHIDENCAWIEYGQAGGRAYGYNEYPVEPVECGLGEFDRSKLCEECLKRHPDFVKRWLS